MGERTPRFKLSTLGPGDTPQDDGFKFTDMDIRLIDRILEYAAELHRHTGEPFVDQAPTVAPILSLETVGGYLPAGVRIFYRWSLIDELGFETAASPTNYIDTLPAVAEPEAAALTYVTTGGALEPGQYSYVISAYKDATTLETKAVRPAILTLNVTTSLNVITLSLPALPPGADGFNIYRKGPGSSGYFFLDSTSGASYDDDGSVPLDQTRQPQRENTTNSHNLVVIDLPGADPVPDGFSWRLYRTFSVTNWDSSILVDMLEAGATPAIATTYDDVGESTRVGAPLSVSMGVGSPPPIRLTNAEDVTGYLPPGRNIVPYVVTFTAPGPVIEGDGTFTWICEYTQADIVHARAFLDSDSFPASQPIIVDVLRQPGGVGAFTTIFTSPGDRPTVQIGASAGEIAVPDVLHLEQGDVLRVDVEQDGGGATLTDSGLSVNVLMMVQFGSESETWFWAGV